MSLPTRLQSLGRERSNPSTCLPTFLYSLLWISICINDPRKTHKDKYICTINEYNNQKEKIVFVLGKGKAKTLEFKSGDFRLIAANVAEGKHESCELSSEFHTSFLAYRLPPNKY